MRAAGGFVSYVLLWADSIYNLHSFITLERGKKSNNLISTPCKNLCSACRQSKDRHYLVPKWFIGKINTDRGSFSMLSALSFQIKRRKNERKEQSTCTTQSAMCEVRKHTSLIHRSVWQHGQRQWFLWATIRLPCYLQFECKQSRQAPPPPSIPPGFPWQINGDGYILRPRSRPQTSPWQILHREPDPQPPYAPRKIICAASKSIMQQ